MLGGQVDEWTGADDIGLISKGKTPQLTCQLTWSLEIQRSHPWITVQTGHLPTVTVMIGSVTMSCCHHADFVATF